MAGPSRRTPQRPQNMGQNRNTAMRNNARAQQNRGTFQGGLGRNQGIAPQGRMPSPAQGMQQCPAGQKPGPMPDGKMGCVPDGPNISGQVPVNNAQRAINPGPGTNKPPKPGY